MLLTGTFHRSVDEKQRVAIPKRIRAALGERENSLLYVAPGTDGSLALYTKEGFQQLARRLSGASPTGPNVRAFSRLFYARAQCVEMDRQGRIRVPPELAQLAGLTKEAVLVGVGDHLELWDRIRWEAYSKEKQAHYDEIAEQAFKATE